MPNIAIIVVAYNREYSLHRLLNSLSKAYYEDENVALIISIDKSDNLNVPKIAYDYEWPFGDKKVIVHSDHLGLKNHIISCGNLSNIYENIIVLEDDLYVSPNFYIFAKEAVIKYGKNDKIAGISLYTHLWNVNCARPFIPADDGYDAYLLQFAQSWGEVWTDGMWKHFMEWYSQNTEIKEIEPDMPANVTSWPESSWLKYFIRYLVKTNRFIVYPRISLTTNFSDRGQHTAEASTSYQVPILLNCKKEYVFPDLDNKSICYDAFFERIGIGDELGLPEKDLCVDLYSTKGKELYRRYWVTMKHENFAIIARYGLQMRPHEINIFCQIEGQEIFCYDTSIYETNRIGDIRGNIRIAKYDLRDTKREVIWAYGYFHIKEYVKRGICKIERILTGKRK